MPNSPVQCQANTYESWHASSNQPCCLLTLSTELHMRVSAYLEELPRVLGDAVRDEHDEVAACAGVGDGLPEDAHAEDELVPVQQRHVRLLRPRRGRHPAAANGQQGRRGEEGGPEPQPGRRRPHRVPHRLPRWSGESSAIR